MEYRIAGGESSAIEFFPFDVQFFNYGAMCGGTIVAKKIVLTAAHCLTLNEDVQEMRVLSNSRFFNDVNANIHKVWSFIKHEKFNHNISFANDVAVILIEDEFAFSPFVQIAYLCSSEIWMQNNERLFVSGWGETKYGDGISYQQLRMTYLNFVSKKRCEAVNNIKLTPDMFCLFGDGKRDTCRGDSGGGVVWRNMVVGIVSHGQGCLNKPAMYVNVSRMRPWIQLAAQALYNKFCFVNKT